MSAPVDNTQESQRLTDTVRRTAITSVLAVAALALVCNIGTLAVPLFNMQVFNRVLPTRDLGTMGALTAGLAISLLVYNLLETLRGVALEVLAARVVRKLSLPLIQAAALTSRPDHSAVQGLADLETVRTFLAGRACMVPFDIAWAPVLLLTLVAMHWALGALGLVCMLILWGLNLLGDAISRGAMLSANEASATALRGAADGVNAAEAVIALGMLPILTRRWQFAQGYAAGLVHRALLRARGVSAATSALRAAMTGATVALGLALALNGLASSGSMVAANMILARLLLPFTSMAATSRQWADAIAAWRRVKTILMNSSPRRYTAALPTPTPRIVVENLSYVPAGGDRALLRAVSFTIEPGESIAVIGPSSSGKTTLLRMLVGMAAPTTGGVYLDGSSTYLWEREDFARHVGFMPQRPILLDESVAENIARMQAPDLAAAVIAAKRVGLHQVIAALPQGYATRLTGNVLSGGQRQRLALARALYGGPRVLILDEPSAFLDQAGETDLVQLLAELRREGVTVLMVTHRPPLLKAVDKVLVLQEGRVAQFGPAAEVQSRLAQRPVRLVKAANDRAAS